MTPTVILAILFLLAVAWGYFLIVKVLAGFRDEARLRAIQRDREALTEEHARQRAHWDLITRLGDRRSS